MNCYYVGYFDTKALADGEIREIRYLDEPRHIFSSKKKAMAYVNAILNSYKEEGAIVEKDTYNPDDPNECWFVTRGRWDEWYITLECVNIQ